MYESGQGVEPNEEEAVLWFNKAATAGNTNAQYKLGTLYENGTGVAKDSSQAVYWYSQNWLFRYGNII